MFGTSESFVGFLKKDIRDFLPLLMVVAFREYEGCGRGLAVRWVLARAGRLGVLVLMYCK